MGWQEVHISTTCLPGVVHLQYKPIDFYRYNYDIAHADTPLSVVKLHI